MKVVILAGGFGTRLMEYTKVIPKPMVKVGGKPILKHIMEIYLKYNHLEFFIALGYKSEIIKKYFIKNYKSKINKEIITINHKIKNKICKINLVETGKNSMTGGRLKRLEKIIGNETFMMTYGDGLANIDLNKLRKFHEKKGKLITVSAVRPAARFGVIKLKGAKVINFQEKPQMQEGWINGGFFVIEPRFFKYIKNDKTILEKEPLEKASKENQLYAYRHDGFWHCMDTKRDKDNLEKLYLKKNASWLK